MLRISPELLKALEEHMFDKHADEAIEAEIWLKAEAQGVEKGLEKGREERREMFTCSRVGYTPTKISTLVDA